MCCSVFTRLQHMAGGSHQEPADGRVSSQIPAPRVSAGDSSRAQPDRHPAETVVHRPALICSLTSSSCSSEISPTISSSKSSRVMIPSRPPCSSTTKPKWVFAFLHLPQNVFKPRRVYHKERRLHHVFQPKSLRMQQIGHHVFAVHETNHVINGLAINRETRIAILLKGSW